MVKWYPYSTEWVKNIMVVFHIYGAIAISLLFCDYQDTGYEWCEIEMRISQSILTQGKNPSPHGTMISIIYNTGGKYCGNSSYLWSYINFTTILWSSRHWIRVMWNRHEHISTDIHPKKISKALW